MEKKDSNKPSLEESKSTFKTPATSAVGSNSSKAFYPETPVQTGAKTEKPAEPHHIYHAFDQKKLDDAPIGNPQLILSMKLDGLLGTFYKRNRCTRVPHPIDLISTNYREAIQATLRTVLTQMIAMHDHIDQQEVEMKAIQLSRSITDGICVLTYCRLRAINYWEGSQTQRFYKRPKVPATFEVPVPYALAITQLGQFHVSGMTNSIIVTPTATPDDCSRYLLAVGSRWSPTDYVQAVVQAKKFGMQFTTVDLTMKIGSGWWLHKQLQDEDVFSIRCPFPEENFTEATAVLHALFCITHAGLAFNPIFDMSTIETDYGTMLRNPPDRIDLMAFHGITKEDTSFWKVS